MAQMLQNAWGYALRMSVDIEEAIPHPQAALDRGAREMSGANLTSITYLQKHRRIPWSTAV